MVGDGLTPNFGPEDQAAYRAARAATAERKQTFDRGAPGQVLQPGGYNARGGLGGGSQAGYAMPVEQVAGRFFNAGRTNATDVAEFVRAAEGRPAAVQALRDFAVGDLRRAAVDDAGRVDPKRWGAWIAKHDRALAAFPDLRKEFSNVQAAQRSVDRVTARRQEAMAGFEKSAAGQFLNKDADQAFGSVIRSGNRTDGLRQLVRMAKGDEAKLEQIRRAAVDHMLRSIENTGAVDAAGNQQLSAAKAIRFMADNGKALQKSGLMSPSQIAVLRAAEEDLRRGTYVATVGRIPGSPTYQNFSSAALLGRLALNIDGQGKSALGNFFSGALGNTVGRAANFLYQVPDRQIRQILTDAMLDPKLARDLMARATPERMESIWSAVGRRAMRAGLVSAATANAAAE